VVLEFGIVLYSTSINSIIPMVVPLYEPQLNISLQDKQQTIFKFTVNTLIIVLISSTEIYRTPAPLYRYTQYLSILSKNLFGIFDNIMGRNLEYSSV
jgi:hypothetical protein